MSAAIKAAIAGQDTLTVLRKLALQKFEVAPEVLLDDQPFEEMGLDSLGLVDLIFQAEDHFLVSIDFELASKTPTLQGLADLIDQLRNAAQPASAA
jgi:acyl carrier protein